MATIPGYTCTLTALADALARARIDIDYCDRRHPAIAARVKFLEELAPIVAAAEDSEAGEEELYRMLMGEAATAPKVTPPVPPAGFMFWTKRCGERHLMKLGLSPSDPGYGSTVCGRPCLGNNYAKERPEADPCPECHKS